MLPYLIDFGFFKLPSYGTALVLAYVAGYFWIRKNYPTGEFNRDFLENSIFYLLIFGFLGGKILYIATFWDDFGFDFLSRLKAALSIDNLKAGFVFYGGFTGAVGALFFYCRLKKFPFLKTADLFSPAAALAHSIGRVGCFMAGCCHGGPTNSFLGVTFSHPYCQTAPHLMGIKIHPTQLYESFGELVIFLILSRLYKKNFFNFNGGIFALYLCLYSLLRFVNEFFRADSRGAFFFGFSQAQFISFFAFLIACSFLIYKVKKHAR